MFTLRGAGGGRAENETARRTSLGEPLREYTIALLFLAGAKTAKDRLHCRTVFKSRAELSVEGRSI